jgi:alanyl-tRNA synthetase
MYTANQIRSKFLDFFKSKQHEIVKSAPLVPHNDPTLMFTNAGMVPFKDVFTQNEKRGYVRATSSQKCVRAGGKHNDLDNVGYTARHHTFFEMLGNFSFGDYFKEDAIKYAWEFVTSDKWLGLPAEKLSVTVYHTDDEAFNIWKDIANLPDEKILRVPTNDNFWAMGDTGPCGPCSEIFYDHGDSIEGSWELDADGNDMFGDRYIEIWNLVFMQYEKLASGDQVDLPAPSIDTGMGLERVAAILQGKHNNYEIDLFEELIFMVGKYIRPYDDGYYDRDKYNKEEELASKRVIADHIRSISFLIADGVMPSNEGRGYVLRRIMRRALRHVRKLGHSRDFPVLYKIVSHLVTLMGGAYPELKKAQRLIEEVIILEEKNFYKTLERGLKLLDEETSSLKEGDVLSGEVAFKLYDTYGFPYDLTVDILRGRSITVDEEGFKKSMQEQKDRAKAAWKGSGEQATEEIWFEIKEETGATEFVGYEATKSQAKVEAIIADGKPVEEIHSGAEASIILNQTPFYGESGGQEGDSGEIISDSGFKMLIDDTQKKLGVLHVHQGKVSKGNINVGDTVTAIVDNSRRDSLRANHSATHILHAVLREVLGDHVTQKGSLVAEDKLRFDISHPKAVSKEELQEVEAKVNEIIEQDSEVGTRVMEPESAIKVGAMALFGEKYGDEVRVVNMGLSGEEDYSVELCGGTHVKRTSDIKEFKIVSESAIAAGIRRIEAITGDEVAAYKNEQEAKKQQQIKAYKAEIEKLKEEAALLSSNVDINLESLKSDDDFRNAIKSLKKQIAKLRKESAMSGDVQTEDINGIKFIGKNFGDVPPKDLRGFVGDLQKKIDSGVVAATSSFDGKGSLIIAVSDDLTKNISAVDLVRCATDILGAKGGGGKPNFAQTGGTNGDKVEEAIKNVRDALAS